MEPQLEGKIVVTGFFGDKVWGFQHPVMPALAFPQAPVLEELSLLEYRLRVGFVALPVPQIAMEHVVRIRQIARAPEMQNWSLGGVYDRPVPRRIVEEAGVQREFVGTRKIAAGFCYPRQPNGMSERSRQEFLYYVQQLPVSSEVLESGPLLRFLSHLHARGCSAVTRLPSSLARFLAPVRRCRLRNRTHFNADIYLYTFHWGVASIRSRYECIPA
jgi:hypothetical protein